MPLESSVNQEQRILLQAKALAHADRAAFLREACGADSELRRRIEARLKFEAIPLPLKPGPLVAGPDGTLVIGDASPDSAGTSPGDTTSERGPAQSCASRFLPGASLAGRYRIVSLIGRGGMGEVYRADDLKLGHPVALKFLPLGLDEQSPLLQHLLNEVRLSRQIAHPNVCRVYDLGEIKGQHFLSMEYIDGEDLQGLLRRIGRLPPDKGVQIAQQLCAGLAAAHDQGVLHRDLKPANIMIDGRGRAHITDFGLARLATSGGSGEVVGTPAYMAPEQLARGMATVQTDIYSLGLVLYEMFTGKPVYTAQTISQLQNAHQQLIESPALFLPDLPPAVERAILRCLQIDPQQRPKTARAVAAALPGSNPLAAALAAGETPSPEMVAAAGGEGVLNAKVGLACLGAVAAGLLLACWLAQSTYRVNHARIDKHPQAMAAEARKIAEKLGYQQKPADFAFEYADDQESGMKFWYRQSPQPLVVFNFYTGFRQLNYGSVEADIPRFEVPGELGVMLSPRGDLVKFQAEPPRLLVDPAAPQNEPEWSRWFPAELLGFDLQGLEKTSASVPRPPIPYDHLQVWRGFRTNTNLFYVAAASFAGRPVYFAVVEPLFTETETSSALPSRQAVASWIYLALIASAVVLAWRNVRLRRSDRQGALRAAFYFLVVGLLMSAIQAHHTTHEKEGGVFEMALAQAATRAIVFWLWYTALEPYVRRFWPETLISWSRLLEGRWKDPLVGRALLVGCLFGIAINLVQQLHLLSPQWLGLKMHQYQTSPSWTLGSPGSLFADILFKQIDAVFYAMFLLMLLLLLRFILRQKLLASIACVAVCTGLTLSSAVAVPWLDWLKGTIVISLVFWALVQWGFLAAVFMLFCNNLLTFPLTTDLSVWYASHGLVAVGLIFVLPFLGFILQSDGNRCWDE